MFFKNKKNKNKPISEPKEIVNKDNFEDEYDEMLRDAYYRGIDGILRQRYEYCTDEVERKIILDNINANIEAYKKEKESQMKLKFKK